MMPAAVPVATAAVVALLFGGGARREEINALNAQLNATRDTLRTLLQSAQQNQDQVTRMMRDVLQFIEQRNLDQQRHNAETEARRREFEAQIAQVNHLHAEAVRVSSKLTSLRDCSNMVSFKAEREHRNDDARTFRAQIEEREQAMVEIRQRQADANRENFERAQVNVVEIRNASQHALNELAVNSMTLEQVINDTRAEVQASGAEINRSRVEAIDALRGNQAAYQAVTAASLRNLATSLNDLERITSTFES